MEQSNPEFIRAVHQYMYGSVEITDDVIENYEDYMHSLDHHEIEDGNTDFALFFYEKGYQDCLKQKLANND